MRVNLVSRATKDFQLQVDNGFFGTLKSGFRCFIGKTVFYWFSKLTNNNLLANLYIFSAPGRTSIVHALRSAGKIGFPAV